MAGALILIVSRFEVAAVIGRKQNDGVIKELETVQRLD